MEEAAAEKLKREQDAKAAFVFFVVPVFAYVRSPMTGEGKKLKLYRGRLMRTLLSSSKQKLSTFLLHWRRLQRS